MQSILTFGVLAGAYPKSHNWDTDAILTHACEVDAQGRVTKVLCNKVKTASICDNMDGTTEAPTCKACQAKLNKKAGK